MPSKRSELASILRRLADYVDRYPDEDLAPIFKQAAALMQSVDPKTKRTVKSLGPPEVRGVATQLQGLPSREAGDALLKEKAPNRVSLEAVARFLQLPVQRDDTVERLRAKIVENTIGSRLRSDAIQGKER